MSEPGGRLGTQSGTPLRKPLRLLLLEDSENDALLLLRELRRGGYEPVLERVSTPEKMRRALVEADERGEPWEIVVSDYFMPRFRAPDALALLRDLGYDTPFIVVSGKVGEETAVEAMRAGAQDYITKENMARLNPAIERELREAVVRRERQDAQKKLREAEVRYRTLVEQIPAITYIQEPLDSDRPKAVTYMSPQYESILGYAAETEIVDEEHWLKVIHPEDRERVLIEEDRTDATGEPFNIEYRIFASDGRVVWVRDQAVLVRDETGKPLFWQGIQYDITEQKRAEEELRASEERYRTFIAQSTEAIGRFELEVPLRTDLPESEQLEHFYRHTYLAESNDEMAKTYGYERAEEAVGTRLDEVLPRHAPQNTEYLRAFIRSGYRLSNIESRELDRNGELRDLVNNLTGIVEKGFLLRVWGTRRDVTQSKRMQEALRRADEKYRGIFENAVEGIFQTTADGRILTANPALARILGYESPEELMESVTSIGRQVYASSAASSEFTRLLTGRGVVAGFEMEARRKDGSTVWLSINARPLRNEAGKLVGSEGTAEDITERKRAEEERRQSEERFQATFDQAAVGMIQVGLDGAWLRYNDRFCDITGYTSEELAEISVFDLISLEQFEDDFERGVKMLAGELRDYSEEKLIVGKGGRRIWADLTVSLVHDESDEPQYFMAVVEDISERRKAEEALVQSEERFRATFDQAAVGVAVVGIDGSWLKVNGKLCEILGYDSREILELTFQDITHPEDLEKDLGYARQLLAGEIQTYSMEKRYFKKDGSIVWINLTVSLVRDVSGAPGYFIAVIEDITQRREAEEALRNSEEQYRTLFETMTQGIVYVNTEGGITSANTAAERILGLTLDQMQGKTSMDPHWKALHEDGSDFPGATFPVVEALSTGREVKGVIMGIFVPETEEYRWVNVDAVPQFRPGESKPYQAYAVFEDISERRRAEEALSQSEELYRTVVEQAAENIFVVDVESKRILESNDALHRSLGYTADEIRDMTLYDIVAHDHESIDENVRSILGRGSYFLGERQYRRTDGTLVDVEVMVSAISYRGTDAMCIVAHDVTERKQNEDSQRFLVEAGMVLASSLDYQTTLASVARMAVPGLADWCAIDMVDENGEIQRLAVAHQDPEKVRWAHELQERFAPDPNARQGVPQVLRTGRTEFYPEITDETLEAATNNEEELRIIREIGFTSVIITPLTARGQTLGVITLVSSESGRIFSEKDLNLAEELARRAALAVDNARLFDEARAEISERRRAEVELKESEERYRAVIEQSTEGIYLFDSDTGAIVESNPALQEMLGYTDAELASMEVYELVDLSREEIDSNIQLTLDEGRRFVGERKYRNKDGSKVYVEVGLSLIHYRGREVICVTVHDISERKRAEQALQEIREQERNRIARDLHDDILQNMVYALQEIQILQITSESGGDPVLEDTAEALRRSVEGLRVSIFELRLDATLDRSLSYSLNALLETNRRMARRRFDIEMAISEDFPQMLPDKTGRELVRIIQEALNNARRHASPQHVRIELGLDGDLAWVEVADDGKGFVPARSQGGVGMSSMGQRMADLGGELDIESEPGEGTRVRFEIPISRLTGEQTP